MFFCLFTFNLQATEHKQSSKSKYIIIDCDGQGFPKKNDLKALVATYYFKRSCPYKICVKEVTGGLFSKKLYLVMINKDGQKIPLFFFKISKKADSTENLLQIQHGPIGEKIQQFKTQPTSFNNISSHAFPEIILLNNVFVYTDQYKSTKKIEVTPAAPAELVQDILESENKDLIIKTSYAIGKSLAAFHLLFINYHDSQDPAEWKTVCHGDFGIKNVLFNPTTNTIYFIDNEGMKTSEIKQDIYTMITSFIMFKYLTKHYTTRWPLYMNHNLAFLKGYIESYPTEKQAALAMYIQKMLDDSLHTLLYQKVVKDPSTVGKPFNQNDFKTRIHQFLKSFTKKNQT